MSWSASDTDILFSSLAVGAQNIVLVFDPGGSGAAIQLAGSASTGEVEEKLYTVTVTEVDAGPPQVLSYDVTRVWRPGDIAFNPPPLGGTANDLLRWNGNDWVALTAPSATGTWILMVVSGTMQWVEGKEMSCT